MYIQHGQIDGHAEYLKQPEQCCWHRRRIADSLSEHEHDGRGCSYSLVQMRAWYSINVDEFAAEVAEIVHNFQHRVQSNCFKHKVLFINIRIR